MVINSSEQAYEVFANHLISFIDGREWDVGIVSYKVFGKMSSAKVRFQRGDKEEKLGGYTKNANAKWDGLDAALFIRDDLVKTTGKRIWGLTFTLWPSGKFNIEYDYNKPDDYDDTDDLISGDEINKSIDNLNG